VYHPCPKLRIAAIFFAEKPQELAPARVRSWHLSCRRGA